MIKVTIGLSYSNALGNFCHQSAVYHQSPLLVEIYSTVTFLDIDKLKAGTAALSITSPEALIKPCMLLEKYAAHCYRNLLKVMPSVTNQNKEIILPVCMIKKIIMS